MLASNDGNPDRRIPVTFNRNNGRRGLAQRLRRDGYAQFRNLCPEPLVRAARAAIDQDLATNFDPKRQVEYDHQSYCPALQRAPVLMALLTESGIAVKLEEVIGLFDHLVGPTKDRLRHGEAKLLCRLQVHH